MSLKFTDLQCKEVICLGSGQRLGFICDVVVSVPDGHVKAIMVPGPCKLWGLVGRQDDYCIPWECIQRIGPDIVLVDTDPCNCRIPRGKPLPF